MVIIPLESLEAEMDKWFANLPKELQEDILHVTGVVYDSLDLDGKRGLLRGYKAAKRERLRRDREERLIKEQHEHERERDRVRMEAFAGIINSAFSSLAEIVLQGYNEHAKQMGAVLVEAQTQYPHLPSGEETSHPDFTPAHVTPMNCIRKHDPTDDHPEGRPGPANSIVMYPSQDGIHMRCMVAYTSQRHQGKGFARTPFQIFHQPLMEQGDCPKPESRNILKRIPGWNWLFEKPDICPLASGEEIVVEYGGKVNG